ncbi:MAG: hypothetical protein WBF89_14055 [Steroidobacteraceae bacterium]|jgi:hypothetical protein
MKLHIVPGSPNSRKVAAADALKRLSRRGREVKFLKEKMAWNYAVSFVLLIAAVVVAFAFERAPRMG